MIAIRTVDGDTWEYPAATGIEHDGRILSVVVAGAGAGDPVEVMATMPLRDVLAWAVSDEGAALLGALPARAETPATMAEDRGRV